MFTPGSTSNSYNFSTLFWNGEIILEALSRCGIRGVSMTQQHTADAWRSINLSLQALNNRSINLFQVEQLVIQLVSGQATYRMPPEVVSVADAYFNIIEAMGAGPDWSFPAFDPAQPIVSDPQAVPQLVIAQSTDRWLRPCGRADYARIPNKNSEGPPTIYWFNRAGPPGQTTITFWPVSTIGYPTYAVTAFCLRSSQDANVSNNETPDVPARFLDWLCADVALRMARKYSPDLIGARGQGGLLDDADEAWRWAEQEDTEKAEISVRPDVYRYWQM